MAKKIPYTSEDYDRMRRLNHEKFQVELGKYIRWLVLHKYGKSWENQDHVALTQIKTKEVFEKVGQRFGMFPSETERQIRGLHYHIKKYGINFDGNTGLFNLQVKRKLTKPIKKNK